MQDVAAEQLISGARRGHASDSSYHDGVLQTIKALAGVNAEPSLCPLYQSKPFACRQLKKMLKARFAMHE